MILPSYRTYIRRANVGAPTVRPDGTVGQLEGAAIYGPGRRDDYLGYYYWMNYAARTSNAPTMLTSTVPSLALAWVLKSACTLVDIYSAAWQIKV